MATTEHARRDRVEDHAVAVHRYPRLPLQAIPTQDAAVGAKRGVRPVEPPSPRRRWQIGVKSGNPPREDPSPEPPTSRRHRVTGHPAHPLRDLRHAMAPGPNDDKHLRRQLPRKRLGSRLP